MLHAECRNVEDVFEDWDSKVDCHKNQLTRSGKGHFLINTYWNPKDTFLVSELSVISIQSNCSKFMAVWNILAQARYVHKLCKLSLGRSTVKNKAIIATTERDDDKDKGLSTRWGCEAESCHAALQLSIADPAVSRCAQLLGPVRVHTWSRAGKGREGAACGGFLRCIPTPDQALKAEILAVGGTHGF